MEGNKAKTGDDTNYNSTTMLLLGHKIELTLEICEILLLAFTQSHYH